MNFKKKLLVGLLSGAMILSCGAVNAAEPEMPEDDVWQEEEAAHRGGWANYFSEKYGVSSAQIEQALKSGAHPSDIHHAAVLAKLSGKNFSDVLAMKVDWFQVADKLGVTREQVGEFLMQERTEFFAKRAGIELKTFQALLKDGYHPHDIAVAGAIAKAANKNIKSVLEKRRINNTWEDVAKSFGVNFNDLIPRDAHHQKHLQGHRMRG
ncbi:MAG: hypothetical protein IKO05_11110 [Selenomonadaceae bacterium]|nr:hypothetical protein [Selenomonadaceae bacterium]